MTPLQELADKIAAVYRALQPREQDPMLNFDERDVLHWAEQAGFTELILHITRK